MSVTRGQCDARPSYLPTRIGWNQIILLDKNLPRVSLDSGTAEIRTRDLLMASLAPYCCTIMQSFNSFIQSYNLGNTALRTSNELF